MAQHAFRPLSRQQRRARKRKQLRVNYVPYHHQYDFHQARWKYRYRWLCGGVTCGKTYAALAEDIELATVEVPGAPGLIVVPDYRTLHENVIPKMRQLLPREVLKVRRRTEGTVIEILAGNGIVTPIFCRSAHNLENVEKINAIDVAWAHLEEACRFKHAKLALTYVVQRMRNPHGPTVGFHLSSSPRPGPIPELFGIKNALPKIALERGYSPKKDFWVRQAWSRWNKSVAADVENMEAFFGDSALGRQDLFGEILQWQGQVYPFHAAIHVIPHELAIQLSAGSAGWGGVDFGYRHPGCALSGGWWGEVAVVRNEAYKAARKLNWWGKWMRDYQLPGTTWWCDDAEPRSIETLSDYVDAQPASLAKKDWLARTTETSTYFDCAPIPHPNPLLRGYNYRPTILISNRCPNLIDELEKYKLDNDPTKIDAPAQSLKHEDCVGACHGIDALGYGLYSEKMRNECRTW